MKIENIEEIALTEQTAKAGRYLTFKLGDELYGVDIIKVQEIIGMMKITQVPNTPTFVKGVINLRDKVIPVIDLRRKFNLHEIQISARTCIIVAQSESNDGCKTLSALVDEVSEVIQINQKQIEPAPSFGTEIDLQFITGIGKINEKVIMLLDVNKVFSF